jgi:hypothetical protein
MSTPMNAAAIGRSTSGVEVTNVSGHGFWLFIADRELSVLSAQFPRVYNAAIRVITDVHLPSPHRSYWPWASTSTWLLNRS